MSKFNKTNTSKTTNKSGHVAYSMQDKEKLVTQVLTSFFGEKKYYGDNTDEMIELAKKVASKEPHFVANLAVYARKEFHLRSVAHALTAVVANEVASKPFIKYAVNGVVERADDITEILACYIGMFGKPIPNGLKKGLADAMNRFNEFQFSKYNGGNKSVKFKDVLSITHAKPVNKRQNEVFKKILDDQLETAVRWETELSAHGNNKETWEKLIDENKIGYMAGLRNLRNIINANPRNIDKIYSMLENKEQVLRSKQLPFRFMSAYREVPKVSSWVLDVLENAIEYSVENTPKLKGKTVIAIDTSGSMSSRISTKSDIQCCDIASLLGVLASRICEEYVVYTFDTRLKEVTFSKRSGIIETATRLSHSGGGTDLKLPLQKMIVDNVEADRLIMISDNEINADSRYYRGFVKTCQSLVDEYRKKVNKDLWVHAIDLQGYGTQQFIGGKTNIIAGWSERVLEFINMAEKGIGNQIKAIENYKY